MMCILRKILFLTCTLCLLTAWPLLNSIAYEFGGGLASVANEGNINNQGNTSSNNGNNSSQNNAGNVIVAKNTNVPSLYADCVFASQSNTMGSMITQLPRNATIRPLSDACYKGCQAACSDAFGLNTDPNAITVNKDNINDCIIQCQSGQTYSGKKRIYAKNFCPKGAISCNSCTDQESCKQSIMQYSSEVSVTSNYSCPTEPLANSNIFKSEYPGYAFFNSGFAVSAGDKVLISMQGNNSSDILGNTYINQIFLCGFASTQLVPNFYSTSFKTWLNATGPQVACTCSYDNCSNLNPNTCSRPIYWNARNPSFVNTGMCVQAGDYLNVSYGGRYHFAVDDNMVNNVFYQVACPNVADAQINFSVQGMPMSVGGSNCITNGTENTNSFSPASSVINGLTFSTTNNMAPNIFLDDKSADDYQNKINAGAQACTLSQTSPPPPYNPSQFPQYSFTGILSAITAASSPLHLQHNDNGPCANWGDNIGGYYVQIDWKGCARQNGQSLQYGIIDAGIMGNNSNNSGDNSNFIQMLIDDSTWTDLPVTSSQTSVTISAATSGIIVFRIKPLNTSSPSQAVINSKCPVNGNILSNLANGNDTYNTNAAYAMGQYDVHLSLISTSATGDVIANLVATIYNTMFDPKTGLVSQLFNLISRNPQILQLIQFMLTIYLAMTGMYFMLGISRITQQDALIRIVKIIFVILLTRKNSWDFFFNTFFQLFTKQLASFIDDFTGEGANTVDGEIIPIIMKEFFTSLSTMFSSVFAQKIVAILLSNFFGFIIGIVILLGVVVFFVCIVKASVIYITAIIVLGVMITLTPIFLPMILFSYTKKYFDAWVKQIITFAIQPVFVFASIWLFHLLSIALLEMILTFTMCKYCFFGVFVGFYNECFLNVYMPLAAAHSPSSFSMPILTVIEVICFLTLSQGMLCFINFSSNLAGAIVNSTAASVSITTLAPTSVKTFVSPITDIYSGGKNFVFGKPLNEKERRARLDALQKDKQKEDENKENRIMGGNP